MGKIRIRLLFILSILFPSCEPSRLIRERFNATGICNHGSFYEKSKYINTNGFYHFIVKGYANTGFPAKEVLIEEPINILFFDNGIVIDQYLPEYFNQAKNKKFGFYNRGTQWGRYSIFGDTIRILSLESPGGMSWLGSETYLKLSANGTLKYLYSVNPNALDLSFNSNQYQYEWSESQFIKDNTLPDPNKSWIIKRKWFWCNKEEYKKWKRERKK